MIRREWGGRVVEGSPPPCPLSPRSPASDLELASHIPLPRPPNGFVRPITPPNVRALHRHKLEAGGVADRDEGGEVGAARRRVGAEAGPGAQGDGGGGRGHAGGVDLEKGDVFGVGVPNGPGLEQGEGGGARSARGRRAVGAVRRPPLSSLLHPTSNTVPSRNVTSHPPANAPATWALVARMPRARSTTNPDPADEGAAP